MKKKLEELEKGCGKSLIKRKGKVIPSYILCGDAIHEITGKIGYCPECKKLIAKAKVGVSK